MKRTKNQTRSRWAKRWRWRRPPRAGWLTRFLCGLSGHRPMGGHLVSVCRLYCRRCGAYPL